MKVTTLYDTRVKKTYKDTIENLQKAQDLALSNPAVVYEFTFHEIDSSCKVCYYKNLTFGYCNFDREFPIEIGDLNRGSVHKVATYAEAIKYIDSIA